MRAEKDSFIISWSSFFFPEMKLQYLNVNEPSFFCTAVYSHVHVINFEHLILNGSEIRVLIQSKFALLLAVT